MSAETDTVERFMEEIVAWRSKYRTAADLLVDEMRAHSSTRLALSAANSREAMLQKRLDELEAIFEAHG